jgi:hypothetical protein
MSIMDTEMTGTVQECNNRYGVGVISNSFAELLLTFANFAPLRLCEKLGRAMKVSRKGSKGAKFAKASD